MIDCLTTAHHCDDGGHCGAWWLCVLCGAGGGSDGCSRCEYNQLCLNTADCSAESQDAFPLLNILNGDSLVCGRPNGASPTAPKTCQPTCNDGA